MKKVLSDQANKNRDDIARIRLGLLTSEFTIEEAKAMAKPIIDAMNERAKEIAEEHGMRFKPLSFTNLMR